MKKNNLFLVLFITCLYSIAYAWIAADVSAGTISGTVSGEVQEGVSISLIKTSCGETLTDTETTLGNGLFIFSDVSNGNYIVRPEKTGYFFSPVQQSISISDNTVTGVDFTATARFTDNGDGTVTDELTHLTWLKDASCIGGSWSYTTAIVEGLSSSASYNCGLSDDSVEGDWRLPTKEELQGIGTNPPATWTDGLPSETWTMPNAPFTNVPYWYYWSSEGLVDNIYGAWAVSIFNGETLGSYIEDSNYVWPVRSLLDYSCGEEWSCPYLVEAGGSETAIAIDQNDETHIVYAHNSSGVEGGAGTVTLKYRNIESEETSIIDSDGYHNSLTVLDSDNSLHLSYIKDGVSYGKKSDGTSVWSTQTPERDESGPVGGDQPSIGVDSAGKSHIAFYEDFGYPDSDLVYVTNAFGSWNFLLIDDDVKYATGSEIGLVVDSSNYVHIAYMDYISYELKYATNKTGSWVVSVIDGSGTIPSDVALAIDKRNDELHIIYRTNSYVLKHATTKDVTPGNGSCSTGSDWDCADVAGESARESTAIVVDSLGNLHICYTDSNFAPNFKYAIKDAITGVWTSTVLASAAGFWEDFLDTGIAVDSRNKAHITYTLLDDYSIPYVDAYYIREK